MKLQCDLAESENKETGQLRLQILLRFEVNYCWPELDYLSPRLLHSLEFWVFLLGNKMKLPLESQFASTVFPSCQKQLYCLYKRRCLLLYFNDSFHKTWTKS